MNKAASIIPKSVNVITSLVGKGLEREYLLLQALLEGHGHRVAVAHYTAWDRAALGYADVNVFLEVVHPLAFSLARENWLFPNPEWWDARNDAYVHKFTKVCCKTLDCERIWKAKLEGNQPERVVFTGFEARDLYDPTVVREDKFLHVAGESEFKNTDAVVEAWRRGNWAEKPLELTVVTRQPRYRDACVNVPGVTCVFGKVPDDELRRLMNAHRFHLLPSAYEGFGHALHEAVGVGALVLTTAAVPMSEVNGIVPEWSVNVRQRVTRAQAMLHQVGWADVQVACNRVAQAIHERAHEFEARQQTARRAFLADREAFRQRILELVSAR